MPDVLTIFLYNRPFSNITDHSEAPSIVWITWVVDWVLDWLQQTGEGAVHNVAHKIT